MMKYNILFILYKAIFTRFHKIKKRSVFRRKRGNVEGLKFCAFREKGVLLGAENQWKGVVLGIKER